MRVEDLKVGEVYMCVLSDRKVLIVENHIGYTSGIKHRIISGSAYNSELGFYDIRVWGLGFIFMISAGFLVLLLRAQGSGRKAN